MKILVYGANGLQGQSIVRQLLKDGYQVRGLVRDIQKSNLLTSAGAEIMSADLNSINLSALLRVHEGVDFAILQFPSGDGATERAKQSEHAIECLRQSKSIRGIIFN